MTKDEIYINQCIQLAKRGTGYVSPNPMVGCVIERDYKILGKDYQKKYGKAHAEVNAIADAKQKCNKIQGAVLYVNLDPC